MLVKPVVYWISVCGWIKKSVYKKNKERNLCQNSLLILWYIHIFGTTDLIKYDLKVQSSHQATRNGAVLKRQQNHSWSASEFQLWTVLASSRAFIAKLELSTQKILCRKPFWQSCNQSKVYLVIRIMHTDSFLIHS